MKKVFTRYLMFNVYIEPKCLDVMYNTSSDKTIINSKGEKVII